MHATLIWDDATPPARPRPPNRARAVPGGRDWDSNSHNVALSYPDASRPLSLLQHVIPYSHYVIVIRVAYEMCVVCTAYT